MSGDTAPGIVNLSWDPQSGVLFIAQGAYNSAYTAYLPLANVSGHKAGQFQPGVPAFEYLDKHPNYEDAFGRKRSEYRTIFGITLNEPGLKPFAWGPSAFYSNIAEEKGKPVRYDKDWESLFGRQGSSYYNTSAFFSLDTEGPLMATTKGADWGHNIAGDAYIFNKHTGLKAVTEWPADPQHEGRRLRPFTSGGALIGNGRVFLAGPGEDRDGDGHLGIRRPEGLIPKVDQGLYLWAYDYSMADKRPGDGVTGPAALETASLKPAFVHRFLSRYQPDPNDIDSYGQSYYETDGFFRRKAMLIDGKSAWMAWKPSQADAVELIHADDKEARTWSLEVGKGLKGVDLWPKISLSEQGGSKTIAYYTGYAQYRKRVMVEDVEAELKKYTHKGNRWEDLSDGDRNGFIRQARETGVWSGELFAPRGPAELAIFDASQGKLKWTYNLSDNHSGLQPNDFWCFIDRSHMVVAGKHVYVGWVDTSGEEAALKLVALDMTADKPTPVERKLPLGFPSKGNEKSALFDLIAVDGTLYALVTQSENLWIRDPRWKSQWVVAVRP
jgi:outer membrane protein assembly factor BamB